MQLLNGQPHTKKAQKRADGIKSKIERKTAKAVTLLNECILHNYDLALLKADSFVLDEINVGTKKIL